MVTGAVYEFETRGTAYFAFRSGSGIQANSGDSTVQYNCIAGSGKASDQFAVRSVTFKNPYLTTTTFYNTQAISIPSQDQSVFVIGSTLLPLYGGVNGTRMVYATPGSAGTPTATTDITFTNGIIDGLPENTYGYAATTSDSKILLPLQTPIGLYFKDSSAHPNGGVAAWTIIP